MKPVKRPCPDCGEPTSWDEEHEPHAWRHDDNISRWCTQTDNTTRLNYPDDCLQPPDRSHP